MSIRHYLQISGSHLIVGLEGKKEHILHEFYSFKAFGATENFHLIGDTFLYFYTTFENLEKAFFKKFEAKLYNRTGIEFESSTVQEHLKKLAKEKVQSLPHEHFVWVPSLNPELQPVPL